MKPLEYVLGNKSDVLRFLKSRFPMYYQSNFFFRDLQFGIQSLLKEKGMSVSNAIAEGIARSFAQSLETDRQFVPIDHQSWMVNIPEFRKPVVKRAAPAKQAVPAKPVPSTPAATTPEMVAGAPDTPERT